MAKGQKPVVRPFCPEPSLAAREFFADRLAAAVARMRQCQDRRERCEAHLQQWLQGAVKAFAEQPGQTTNFKQGEVWVRAIVAATRCEEQAKHIAAECERALARGSIAGEALPEVPE